MPGKPGARSGTLERARTSSRAGRPMPSGGASRWSLHGTCRDAETTACSGFRSRGDEQVNAIGAGALFGTDPTGSHLNRASNLGVSMLKKLLVALVASAFALGAYAQAPKAEPKAEPKADTKTEAKKDGQKKAAKSTKKSK